MTRKWETTKKRPTAAHEKALELCKKGEHTNSPTFRPGETVCTACGMVVYCPACLDENHLQVPLVHAYPLLCAAHKNVEVKV